MFAFTDGSCVYNNFKKSYNVHKNGFVILGPPGIGKTTFVQNQPLLKKDWIDSDDLLSELGVDWKHNNNNVILNYMRADYILEQSKLFGFRLIGGLFWEYVSDAMVIPKLGTHLSFALQRNDINKDAIIECRQLFKDHAEKYNIPIFESINDAIKYLNKLS